MLGVSWEVVLLSEDWSAQQCYACYAHCIVRLIALKFYIKYWDFERNDSIT